MIKRSKFNKLSMVTVLMVVSLAVLLPAVASAQEEDIQRDRPAVVSKRIEERKTQAKTDVSEKRESTELKSKDARKDACEKRQSKITSAMSRIATKANKHVETFDKIYERVQGFYVKGQLTVANYDELNAAVAKAQAAATLEASVLSELNVEIDCENPDVANIIATYRGSANAAKESLKAYRAALVDLISSLKSENAQQKTTDSEQTNETDQETQAEPESTETEGAN